MRIPKAARLLAASMLAVVAPGAWAGEDRVPSLRFDPFAGPDLAQAAAPAAPPDAGPGAAWTPILRATLFDGADSLADLGGVVLSIGGETHGYRLLEVRPFEAVFAKDGQRIVLPVQRAREGARP